MRCGMHVDGKEEVAVVGVAAAAGRTQACSGLRRTSQSPVQCRPTLPGSAWAQRHRRPSPPGSPPENLGLVQNHAHMLPGQHEPGWVGTRGQGHLSPSCGKERSQGLCFRKASQPREQARGVACSPDLTTASSSSNSSSSSLCAANGSAKAQGSCLDVLHGKATPGPASASMASSASLSPQPGCCSPHRRWPLPPSPLPLLLPPTASQSHRHSPSPPAMVLVGRRARVHPRQLLTHDLHRASAKGGL